MKLVLFQGLFNYKKVASVGTRFQLVHFDELNPHKSNVKFI